MCRRTQKRARKKGGILKALRRSPLVGEQLKASVLDSWVLREA